VLATGRSAHQGTAADADGAVAGATAGTIAILGRARPSCVKHPERSQMSGKRISSAVVVVAALASGAVGAAFAAKPKSPVVKGGSYSGTLAAPRTSFTVSFKVSKNGKQVTALKTNNIPFYCSGGGPAVPIAFKDAAIAKAATFTSTGVQIISSGPKKGQKGATLTITGRFLAGGKESGKITTTFPKSIGSSCSGASRYSTKA
jgi:hypothetical protein